MTCVPMQHLSTWPKRKIPHDKNNNQQIHREWKRKHFFSLSDPNIYSCLVQFYSCVFFLYSLAVAFPFILLHIYVLNSAFSISFLSLATHLAVLIIHPDAERLHVYLIIFWPPDLNLKAAMEADITICLGCVCVWAAVSEEIMGIANRNNRRKHTLK